MELITILNLCHRHRGFVYQHARFGADKKSIEVDVRPREGSAAVCSGCQQPAPGYDHLPERCFEFIPLWGFLVFLLYRMRRVDCRNCGVVVEQVPWGDGKHQLTRAYMLFLARWARKLSWKETADAFRTSWEKVFDAVEHVVTFGLEHRKLGAIDAIGVDEIQYAKGHKYLTLVYQIDLGVTRLLWVGKERTIEFVGQRSGVIDALDRKQFADLLETDLRLSARNDGADSFAVDSPALRPDLARDAEKRKQLAGEIRAADAARVRDGFSFE